MIKSSVRAVALCLIALPAVQPVHATWAVVLADGATGEVGIGQATCVGGIDLRSLSAVIVPGKGAATVQAFVDGSGVSRSTIRDELLAGTTPVDILTLLSTADPAYETHQYCLASVSGAATYMGTTVQSFDFHDGQTGQVGSIRYCVAGNVLAGSPVVAEAVEAVLNTPGSLAGKLMAAMEAARSMGGDGRCSCSPADPPGCGSPPAAFDATAVNGYLVAARTGDTECAFCTGGSYYMDLSVTFRPEGSPDPVTVLQGRYDSFVLSEQGRPDAIRSTVGFDPPALLPDGASSSQLSVELLDLDGNPIAVPINGFTVGQATGSDAVSTIGPPVGSDGNWSTTIGAGVIPGVDLFEVTADDGQRPVILMPAPRIGVGVPNEVTNLRWADRTTLLWDAATGAELYRVYRGDLALLDCGFLGECRDDLDPDPTDLTLTDPTLPVAHAALFYLITGVDGAGTESILGVSGCGIRANVDSCM